MNKIKRNWLRTGLFIGAGVLAGFLYYALRGCQTVCPISSSPWRTAVYTGVIGWLVSIALKPKSKED